MNEMDLDMELEYEYDIMGWDGMELSFGGTIPGACLSNVSN